MKVMGRRNNKAEVDPKWADSIGKQIESVDRVQAINTKALPIDMIEFAGNPREVAITPEDIRRYLPELQLPPKALQEVSDDDWMKDYEGLVESIIKDPAKKKDFLSIAILASSLKSASRLINPILVWRDGSRFYKITGERRLLAHVLLEEETIEAKIYEQKPSDFQIAQLQWEENFQREDLCLHDTLTNLKLLVKGWQDKSKQDGISLATFRHIAGMPRSTAAKYLKVLTSEYDELWEAIRDGHVDQVTKAFELASATPSDFRKTIKRIKGGEQVSATELRRERAASGKRTRRAKPGSSRLPKVTNPTWVRRARKKDIKAMKVVVSLASNSLKDKELIEKIKALDLDSAKGVSAAMELVVKAASKLSQTAD